MSQPPEYPGRDRLQRIAQGSSGSGPGGNRGGRAYEGAFEAVGAILIATLLGYWFDEHFETTPKGVLVGAAIGFAAFVLRLVRLGRQLHPTGAEPADGQAGREAPGERDAAGGPGVEPGLSRAFDDEEEDDDERGTR